MVFTWGKPTSSVPWASSRDPRKVNTLATAMPGMANGSVIRKNVRKGPAPASLADSSCCLYTPRKAPDGIHVINIMEFSTWMMITPTKVPMRFSR